MTAQTLLKYVKATRQYGHTYIHANVRREVPFGWKGLEGEVDGRKFAVTFRGWGRSLHSPRGHKYKAHARWADNNKPVPSKVLAKLIAAKPEGGAR